MVLRKADAIEEAFGVAEEYSRRDIVGMVVTLPLKRSRGRDG